MRHDFGRRKCLDIARPAYARVVDGEPRTFDAGGSQHRTEKACGCASCLQARVAAPLE